MASTIRDVAKLAGVSISTVSRVLNNTCAVAEDKRIRVERAASELGYIPNPNARSLLKKGTGGIGILLPYVTGEFFSEFLTGTDEIAKNNEFFLLISASHHQADEWRASVQSVYKRVDGLIVMAPQMTPEELNLRAGVPTVFVNTPVLANGTAPVDVFNFDNAQGTRTAAEYLLGLGHRRFVYVRGPERAYDAAERTRGFLEAMAAAGISEYAILEGGYERADGTRAAQQILGMPSRPTAVMAANDYCALGVMTELRSGGVNVPGEVSVVGFDNVPSAHYAMPSLTTVSVPIRRIGIRAIECLIDRIRSTGRTGSQNALLPVELVIHESTAPPPG